MKPLTLGCLSSRVMNTSHLDLSGSKKRRRGERVFKFKKFGEKGHPVDWFGGGVFAENVEALLEFGNSEGGLCSGTGGMASWSFQLEVHRHPPVHLLLFVVEEPVEVALHRHCAFCQYVGWGHHMICNKKYHFLVPSKYTAPTNDRSSNLLTLKGHIMHGVFHSNGYGHLLGINGLEMGSVLPGYRIMEFWDRLCSGLRAREVSMKDISQKKGMDLRLTHGVAYGEPWFGRWGYRFGRGTYGVTKEMYQKAIEALQTMPLCLLVHHLGTSNYDFSSIISRYQTISNNSLSTLGDLFNFMLELESRLPKESSNSYNTRILIENTCRWSPKRVEMATTVIVEALKRAEFRWVSRQEVRDAARAYIGDTGLLDFVLKSLGNHIVGNYLVRRSLNPVTKVLEYCLKDISNSFLKEEGLSTSDSNTKVRYMITRVQLMKDMFYLYKHILIEQNQTITMGVLATLPIASRIILDSKYLIREYYGDMTSKLEPIITSECMINATVTLSNDNCEDERLKNVMAPYECFKLKNDATIDDLKLQVEKRFREIYWGLRSFGAQSILNVNAKGLDSVFTLVEVGGKVVFEGRNEERETLNEDILEDILESNPTKFVVDCACGAKENDGERMICCDICEAWQHTRCVRIPEDQEIPIIFLCSRCEQEILLFSKCLP